MTSPALFVLLYPLQKERVPPMELPGGIIAAVSLMGIILGTYGLFRVSPIKMDVVKQSFFVNPSEGNIRISVESETKDHRTFYFLRGRHQHPDCQKK
jgi:hypothetical protein